MADTDRNHPLQPTRPKVPPSEQPQSTQSHPEFIDDFDHDGTVAHEHSDVNIRAIAAFVIGLFILGIIVHIGLLGLMNVLERQAAYADPAISPLAVPAGTLPPEPRLLTNEPEALQQLRNEEDNGLKDLERAKREVVGNLPAREGTRPQPPSPARTATWQDTSSGRRQ